MCFIVGAETWTVSLAEVKPGNALSDSDNGSLELVLFFVLDLALLIKLIHLIV